MATDNTETSTNEGTKENHNDKGKTTLKQTQNGNFILISWNFKLKSFYYSLISNFTKHHVTSK